MIPPIIILKLGGAGFAAFFFVHWFDLTARAGLPESQVGKILCFLLLSFSIFVLSLRDRR